MLMWWVFYYVRAFYEEIIQEIIQKIFYKNLNLVFVTQAAKR